MKVGVGLVVCCGAGEGWLLPQRQRGAICDAARHPWPPPSPRTKNRRVRGRHPPLRWWTTVRRPHLHPFLGWLPSWKTVCGGRFYWIGFKLVRDERGCRPRWPHCPPHGQDVVQRDGGGLTRSQHLFGHPPTWWVMAIGTALKLRLRWCDTGARSFGGCKGVVAVPGRRHGPGDLARSLMLARGSGGFEASWKQLRPAQPHPCVRRGAAARGSRVQPGGVLPHDTIRLFPWVFFVVGFGAVPPTGRGRSSARPQPVPLDRGRRVLNGPLGKLMLTA